MGNLRARLGAGMWTDMQPGKAKSVGALIDAAVRGELSKSQALRLCKDNPEVITLALLAAGQRIAELEGQKNGQQPSPSTPSGMVPLYAKPNTPKRRKKPGAKSGHAGVRRERPVRIDEHGTHRLKCCRLAVDRRRRHVHRNTRT